jgi:hypothetical protein
LLIADFEFLDESGLKLFQKLKNKKIYLASILQTQSLPQEKMNLSGYLGAFRLSAFSVLTNRRFRRRFSGAFRLRRDGTVKTRVHIWSRLSSRQS